MEQFLAGDRDFAIRQTMSVYALAIFAPGTAQVIEHVMALTRR